MLRTRSDRVVMGVFYGLVALFALICIYPMLLTLTTSFTDEQALLRNGYRLIPEKFSLSAYEVIFQSMRRNIFRAYGVTILVTVLGTVMSMVVSASFAYAVSVKNFRQRNILNMLLYIPMVFSAGLLPWYIACTRYYGLTNQIWAMILPNCLSVFNVFLLRNFFASLPGEISEAARIDGAGHFRIYVSIAVPMAQVGLVTVALFYALNYWNDFYLALLFIRKSELYPMQYYLYNILSNIQFAARQAQTRMTYQIDIPSETIKMAIICITVFPILFLYPFAQRYFVRGVIVGAVKG